MTLARWMMFGSAENVTLSSQHGLAGWPPWLPDKLAFSAPLSAVTGPEAQAAR